MDFTGRVVMFAGPQPSAAGDRLTELGEMGRSASRLLGAWAERVADATAAFSVEDKLDAFRSSLQCAPAVSVSHDEVEVFDALLPAGDDEGKWDVEGQEELSTQDASSDCSDSVRVAADAESPMQSPMQSPEPPDLITLEPQDLISFEPAAGPPEASAAEPQATAALPSPAREAPGPAEGTAAGPVEELADVFAAGVGVL